MPDIALSPYRARSARRRGIGIALFLAVIAAAGVIYVIDHLVADSRAMRESSALPFILLGLALVIALGFEFVNGFHDTANAVATIIYTNSLDPHPAVAWSGAWNFIGVLDFRLEHRAPGVRGAVLHRLPHPARAERQREGAACRAPHDPGPHQNGAPVNSVRG